MTLAPKGRGMTRALLFAACAVHLPPARAAGSSPVVTLPEVDVYAADAPSLTDRSLMATRVSSKDLRQLSRVTADTTELFSRVPGFSMWNAGGISALPVIDGMADDNVATMVDGVRIQPACPNHMNPALSYITPDMVANATVIAGITPVSLGGDSLGGTVSVERRDPQFARRGKVLVTGWARGAYHSNGGGWEGSASATVANDTWSLNYSASYQARGDYHMGGGEGVVRSSLYKNVSHSVTLGYHKGNHLLAVTAGQSDTPYEGFPNAWMDMTNNRSTFVNGKYTGAFDWGTLEARGYWQRVDHVMNDLADKGGHSWDTGMPMNDRNRIAGYQIKATIPFGRRNTLRIGDSFDHQWLADWWPPLPGSMMMGPNTYQNIDDGRRDRLGNFVEWEAHPAPHVQTLLGVRSDVVRMNTGNVQPYDYVAPGMGGMSTGMSGMGGMSGMAVTDSNAADAFNAQNHHHTYVNFDLTALMHWDATDRLSIEGGYARKSRAPNLFELYSWGRSEMASTMIGWFGDGNGYVGNNHLQSAIAHNVSVTADWHDQARKLWELKVQPYFIYTENYINVNRLKTFSDGFALLQFANHNAQSYGINASGHYTAWSSPKWGTGVISAKVDWVRAQDLVTHTSLYHQMPTNGFVALDETYGNWSGRAEVVLVKRKSTVDALRSEPRTPGYALLNLTASYRWKKAVFQLGLDNVLNQAAYLPLGGVALGNYIYAGRKGALLPVGLMGRSVNASVTMTF